MKLWTCSPASLLLIMAVGGLGLVGCDSKPAAENATATNKPANGELAVAPVIAAEGTTPAPATETITAGTAPATPAVKSTEPENPRDANDDGLPDDAHIFDIPMGSNAVVLQFIAEAPGRMLSSEDEETGGLAIAKAAEQVLKNNPTPAERRAAAEAMFYWLQRLQALYAREAADVQLYWKLRLADFAETEDAELAQLVARYRLLQQALDWNHLRPDQRDDYAAQLPMYFAERPLDEADLETAQQVAEAILKSGDRPAAIGIYRSLAEILKASSQEDIAAEAAKLDGMAQRQESLGQVITLDATKLDGEPLDWDSYRGKVVLIDYWATWCGPCIAELPNIRKLYDIYHERGFDVIGVSVDTDKAELESFVKKNEIPWTVTFHADEASPGLSQPLAVQFGISTVPVALLVDQEGQLIALEARGDDLAAWLEQLLGPADIANAPAVEVPADASEKPAAEESDAAKPAEEKPAAASSATAAPAEPATSNQ